MKWERRVVILEFCVDGCCFIPVSNVCAHWLWSAGFMICVFVHSSCSVVRNVERIPVFLFGGSLSSGVRSIWYAFFVLLFALQLNLYQAGDFYTLRPSGQPLVTGVPPPPSRLCNPPKCDKKTRRMLPAIITQS